MAPLHDMVSTVGLYAFSGSELVDTYGCCCNKSGTSNSIDTCWKVKKSPHNGRLNDLNQKYKGAQCGQCTDTLLRDNGELDVVVRNAKALPRPKRCNEHPGEGLNMDCNTCTKLWFVSRENATSLLICGTCFTQHFSKMTIEHTMPFFTYEGSVITSSNDEAKRHYDTMVAQMKAAHNTQSAADERG